MTGVRLPDQRRAVTLVTAPGTGPGWWAGAPSRATWRGVDLLTYRLRAPRPRRGYEVRVARLEGDRVVDLCAIAATRLSSPSLERACLVARERELLLYLSYVDPADGRWRIDVVGADDPARFDPGDARSVLTAASTGTEGVKDPVVVSAARGTERVRGPVRVGDGGALLMYASVAVRDGSPDHGSGDVFATGTVRSATGAARSADGRHWRWEGVVLAPPRSGWDAYETRISCLLAPDLALYDGIARPEENYAERTGIARRTAAGRWERVTTDAPVLDARYTTFDGERFFWEAALPDGSHELRAAAPGIAPGAAAFR